MSKIKVNRLENTATAAGGIDIDSSGNTTVGGTATFAGAVAAAGAVTATNTAKAWVNFNGTGTVAIRASYNVSSITDNGTGDYTVNFTNNMADENFIASVQVVRLNDKNTTGNIGFQSTYGGNKGVSFVRVTSLEISGINLVDADMFDVGVFGN